MYIRLTTTNISTTSHAELGLFQVIISLRAAGRLSDNEQRIVNETLIWFDLNLPEPQRLARSRRPHAENKAIGWFKDTATDMLQRMEEFANILREHDFQVNRYTTDRPGYIVYEDEYQIAAEPFRAEKK